MSDNNKKINDMIRGAKVDSLTAVASQRNKTLNDEIRSKVNNRSVTVGGERPQATPEAQQGNDGSKPPEAPKAPPGNAGNGAYVVADAPRPSINDALRSAWRGKQRNVINRYDLGMKIL
jgi:hypothetical protein